MLVLKTTYLMNVSSDLSNNTLYIYVIYLELVLFFHLFSKFLYLHSRTNVSKLIDTVDSQMSQTLAGSVQPDTM